MKVPTRASRDRARAAAWKTRRAELLQAAYKEVAARCASGEKVLRTIKTVARKYRGRSLGGGRQLDLSAKSLERIWYAFRAKGKAAFALRYISGRKRDLDPLMLNLIVQSAIRQSRSVSEILTQAAESGSRGERVSLATIYRSIPSKEILDFLHCEKRLLARKRVLETKLVALSAEIHELRRRAEQKFCTKGTA